MHRRTLSLALGCALAAPLFALVAGTTRAAAPVSYTFTPVAFIGDAAPGGGNFVNGFQPTRLNSSGDLAVTAALTDGSGEGVFLATGGKIIPIMRGGRPAPGGGTFGGSEFGNLGLNDAGDVALAYSLVPDSPFPLGVNVGLYRWARATQTLAAVVVPRRTPAPGGGTFAGVRFNVSLNNRGDTAFSALTATDKGIHVPGQSYVGYGAGTYVADAQGKIAPVAVPGDPAPGGSTFDLARDPIINDEGDIAFAGHRASDPVGAQYVPQATRMSANTNVYLRRAASGEIEAVASVGDPLPGGGALISGGVSGLNTAGDLLFSNTLKPATAGGAVVLYLRSSGQTARVAGPGDAMPGGGNITLIAASNLNNNGDVVFNAGLDTKEEGVYLYSQGMLSLIARSGIDIPGVGTIFDLEQGNTSAAGLPASASGRPAQFALLNDRGQVAFPARLKDARIGLMMATPAP